MVYKSRVVKVRFTVSFVLCLRRFQARCFAALLFRYLKDRYLIQHCTFLFDILTGHTV
jgi:hypothetical protein